MRILFLVILLLWTPLATAKDKTYPGQMPAATQMNAAEILHKAHDAAGGESWRRPLSLRLEGHAVMYRDGAAVRYERYAMWRVYDWSKRDAHAADGKVRIEGWKDGRTVLLLIFDGEKTYDLSGAVADQSANAQWASNFGFGAIRHGLDEGWSAKRLPDDWMDGRAVHMIELKDPAGGVTRFGIDQKNYQVLYAGFDTPRGWHERRYSDFYTKKGVSWVQPARVRLYYDGVKQNEIVWTDFELNTDMPDGLFAVGSVNAVGPEERSE
jgi:hypothetical protein